MEDKTEEEPDENKSNDPNEVNETHEPSNPNVISEPSDRSVPDQPNEAPEAPEPVEPNEPDEPTEGIEPGLAEPEQPFERSDSEVPGELIEINESSEPIQLREPSNLSGTLLEAAIRHKSKTSEKSGREDEKPCKENVLLIEPKNRGCAGGSGSPIFANFNCNTFLQKRNPFIHDPPQPEERRARVQNPSTTRDYIINLREDLADFQESHGLPRTRDYSFLSLGLALAQETARALCSLFFMFVELFPIIAIISLVLRFALDKLIEILETTDPSLRVRKAIIFSLQMLLILIPLWIFIGTIIIPLLVLVLSIFKKVFHLKGGKPCKAAPAKPKEKVRKDCKQSFFFFN